MPLRQATITGNLTPELRAAFSRTVTLERWKTYQRAAGFDEQLAHRLYLWNAAAGQSFHFPLQTVEVALRNVVHHSLATVYGPDWPREQACRVVLNPKQVEDITKAERRHYSMKQQIATTPQIVASLSFGFWTALLHRHYSRAIWGTQLTAAFPNLAPGNTVSLVSRTAKNIQILRNRIFHQEPLIGHNLSGEYGDILMLLGWIRGSTKEWMRAHSSVPEVLRMRPR